MIRATTGGVLRSYRKNLMSSFIASNKARDTVLTQRNFNSYAEDPAAAAKAFRLRMSRLTVKSQYDICQDAYYKFQTGFSCLDTVSKLIDTENGGTQLQTLKSTTLKMLNDPTGDARTQLSKVLNEMSETIVQNMNQKYGDDFIFAGADGQNVPFTVETKADGTKQLLYRGVPVDAAVPKVAQDASGNNIWVDYNGRYDDTVAGGGGDPNAGYYLKTYNTSVMSKDAYTSKYVPPEVEKGVDFSHEFPDQAGSTQLIPKEYNADGTEKGKDDPGGYYKVTGANDLNRTDLPYITVNGDKYISVEKYNQMVTAAENKPDFLMNTTSQMVEVDSNGVPTAGGDYYLVLENGAETISKIEYDTAKVDADKLKYLMNEKRFVDIGLGFQENEDGKLIESSAFNESLNGLTFLGYGLDEDGDPKNIYSIVQRLTEIADSVPDGQDWSKETYDEFDALVGKLEAASSEFKTQYTNMDAGTLKLKSNLDLLEDNFYNLDEQTSNLEDVDMVEAITSFIWAEYCYNAALKVGNSILSQSLMDYMS